MQFHTMIYPVPTHDFDLSRRDEAAMLARALKHQTAMAQQAIQGQDYLLGLCKRQRDELQAYKARELLLLATNAELRAKLSVVEPDDTAAADAIRAMQRQGVR